MKRMKVVDVIKFGYIVLKVAMPSAYRTWYPFRKVRNKRKLKLNTKHNDELGFAYLRTNHRLGYEL